MIVCYVTYNSKELISTNSLGCQPFKNSQETFHFLKHHYDLFAFRTITVALLVCLLSSS